MRTLVARLRTAAWLGWQVESNWADPLVFVVYAVARPLAMALVLAGMYWALDRSPTRHATFAGFYLANAFHVYVTRVVIGMGWIVVEEREDYETLKYVYASPIGMFTYLTGRGSVKIVLATVSLILTLIVGWFLVGVRWNWAHVAWAPLVVSFVLGMIACLYLGLLVAGAGLLLPRTAMLLNEGLAAGFYLLCGVIFPIDLLPHGLQELSMALPLTLWYETLRRALLGHGASARLGHWSDLHLVGALALSTVACAFVSRWGYQRMEDRARQLGRLDQTTMF
jgi:ABC-2 type transport system permease protein